MIHPWFTWYHTSIPEESTCAPLPIKHFIHYIFQNINLTCFPLLDCVPELQPLHHDTQNTPNNNDDEAPQYYVTSSSDVTWCEAKQLCESNGLTLLTIENEETSTDISALLRDHDELFHIAGKFYLETDGRCNRGCCLVSTGRDDSGRLGGLDGDAEVEAAHCHDTFNYSCVSEGESQNQNGDIELKWLRK